MFASQAAWASPCALAHRSKPGSIKTMPGSSWTSKTVPRSGTQLPFGQSFDFTGDLGNFSLMHGEFMMETRAPGTYAVSETLPDGWQLDSATCSDGSPVDAIVLETGQSVTCTFNNSMDAAALSVPMLSLGGFLFITLMMMLIAAVFLRRY